MDAWARSPHSGEVTLFLDELMRPWREDLAEIVEQGVAERAFCPEGPVDDFPLRFCAVLDGLSVLRLRQMPDLPSERLAELALKSARAELGPRR